MPLRFWIDAECVAHHKKGWMKSTNLSVIFYVSWAYVSWQIQGTAAIEACMTQYTPSRRDALAVWLSLLPVETPSLFTETTAPRRSVLRRPNLDSWSFLQADAKKSALSLQTDQEHKPRKKCPMYFTLCRHDKDKSEMWGKVAVDGKYCTTICMFSIREHKRFKQKSNFSTAVETILRSQSKQKETRLC